MSRVGLRPIEIPEGVEVSLEPGSVIVKGPKGTLNQAIHRDMRIARDDSVLRVERPSDERTHRALHGLTRSLVANMVEGVTKGFEKRLEIHGMGYRATLQGTTLTLLLGYSHPIVYEAPDTIEFELSGRDIIIVRGIDKQMVGQVAAEIRAFRKPEPYKGKGIRYVGEVIRRKVGKTAV
ncbi:MAG: 50S ribosomal protein L6 [bacterium]|nr:50S ribosomal protein L6 [bacterium]MCZ6700937.1 50S ribosomal protein L6 [bacterium]MDV2478982.1 50S ribosomal protein L6 [bacterium]